MTEITVPPATKHLEYWPSNSRRFFIKAFGAYNPARCFIDIFKNEKIQIKLRHLHNMWVKDLIKSFFFAGILMMAMIGAIMICASYLMFIYDPVSLIIKKVITSIAFSHTHKKFFTTRAFAGINNLSRLNNLQYFLESTVWNTDKGTNIQH